MLNKNSHGFIILGLVLASSACSIESRMPSNEAPAKPTIENESPSEGKARDSVVSFYGDSLAGKKTASGEKFNPEEATAAHRSLPFGTKVKVTNPANNKQVIVSVNDHGPFVKGREFDLSKAAARQLGIEEKGVKKVNIEVMEQPSKSPREGLSGQNAPPS